MFVAMKDGENAVAAMATAWHVPLDEALALRYWSGEYVVYNPLTGNTHLLDIVAGELLKRIAAGTATTDELCGHVAEFLDVPRDARTMENVVAILAALDHLGLIEPIAR